MAPISDKALLKKTSRPSCDGAFPFPTPRIVSISHPTLQDTFHAAISP